MRELLVLRHAKSAWDTDAATDHDRPLAKRGRNDCPRLAGWLAGNGLEPDHVVCSTAMRAIETATRVLRELSQEDRTLDLEPRLYHAGLDSLLAVLAEQPPGAERVLLVGHNPGLDDLVLHLAGGAAPLAANGKLMVTAAAAWFHLPDDWEDLETGSGTLIGIARPKELD